MIVVSDTTPLISLLKIGRLDLLQNLFDTVQIPQAVFNELTSNSAFSDEAQEIQSCPFIHIHTVDEKDTALLHRTTGLELGECEAIILTETLHADLTLLDEVRAREVAQQMGLRIMGAVGILELAYKHGDITKDDIREYIAVLRASGRHIGDWLYERLLAL